LSQVSSHFGEALLSWMRIGNFLVSWTIDHIEKCLSTVLAFPPRPQ
jgi:hypothetical protein